MVISARTENNGSKESMSSAHRGSGFKRVSFQESEYRVICFKLRKLREKVKLRIVKYYAGAVVHPGTVEITLSKAYAALVVDAANNFAAALATFS